VWWLIDRLSIVVTVMVLVIRTDDNPTAVRSFVVPTKNLFCNGRTVVVCHGKEE
jgi:hypothetical protein